MRQEITKASSPPCQTEPFWIQVCIWHASIWLQARRRVRLGCCPLDFTYALHICVSNQRGNCLVFKVTQLQMEQSFMKNIPAFATRPQKPWGQCVGLFLPSDLSKIHYPPLSLSSIIIPDLLFVLPPRYLSDLLTGGRKRCEIGWTCEAREALWEWSDTDGREKKRICRTRDLFFSFNLQLIFPLFWGVGPRLSSQGTRLNAQQSTHCDVATTRFTCELWRKEEWDCKKVFRQSSHDNGKAPNLQRLYSRTPQWSDTQIYWSFLNPY